MRIKKEKDLTTERIPPFKVKMMDPRIDEEESANLGESLNMYAQQYMDDISPKEDEQTHQEEPVAPKPKKKKHKEPKEDSDDLEPKTKASVEQYSIEDFRVKVPLDKVAVRSKNEPKPIYSCEKCEYTSKWRHSLNKHVKIVHDNIRDYACTECLKPFADKGKMNDHMKRMHLTKPYERAKE